MTLSFPLLRRTLLLVIGLCGLAGTAAAADEVYPLRKLLIADSEPAAAALNDAEGGTRPVVVRGVSFLEDPSFTKAMAPYLGRPINTDLVNQLIAAIIEYGRAHDILVSSVVPPNKQNVSQGTLRLGVMVGRYNQIIFKGQHWFTPQFLQGTLGIKSGDEVRRSTLEEAVQWANSNPFRQMQVFISQLPDQPGKADLIVTVRDTRPLKVVGSYTNAGVPLIGRNQYAAAAQIGNLWNLDHQLSYQFITTDSLHLFQAHSLAYTAPLPWRHVLEFNASYVRARPTLLEVLDQTGVSSAFSGRYRIPLGGGDRSGDVYAGVDFKESNNNLESGGIAISAAKIDIFQAVIGGSLLLRDLKGAWAFSGSAALSPGHLNSRNTDAAFQPGEQNGMFHVGRFGARARYATLNFGIQRWLKLSHDWDFYSRVSAQLASSNLPSDEQFVIGGAGSVRGFNPATFSGEQGFTFNNDLLTPVYKHTLSFLPKSNNTLETRFGVFYDAGQVFYRFHYPLVNRSGVQVGWDDDYLRPLASTGVTLKMNLGTNFVFTFDYGIPTTNRKAPLDSHGMGHVKVVLAY